MLHETNPPDIAAEKQVTIESLYLMVQSKDILNNSKETHPRN